jgi:hypothetical protein
MTPQQYERLTELFHAALEIAPTEREIFLDHVSESDAELRVASWNHCWLPRVRRLRRNRRTI